MLKITARQIVAGVGTGLLAGTLVAALELDVQGQICEYNQATEHEDCTTYRLFPFLLIQVFNTLNYYGVAITALATVAIGVFTLTLKLSTDRLWEAGEKQRRLYEDTAERQLRAYVFPVDTFLTKLNIGDIPEFHITIKNTGQTPAYKLRHVTRFKGAPFPLTEPLQKISFSDGIIKSLTNLGPSGELHKSGCAPIPLTAQAIDDLNAGRTAIYAYGEFCFIDAFKRSRWVRYRVMTGGNVGFQVGGRLVNCDEGNETSED